LQWIDANPWLSVAAFFAAGALLGLVLRRIRRGKYGVRERAESREVAA
jgi:hypothetical protein